MKFIAVCLHSLDMRDFHSHFRDTPFLDFLRSRSIFIPMGRSQGHHQGDSLNAEMTGIWTSRFCESVLTEEGYAASETGRLPKTVIEHFQENGHDIFTCIRCNGQAGTGTWAVNSGMADVWLKEEPQRLTQFNLPQEMTIDEWLDNIKGSKNFYAHIFLRQTHRPWTHNDELFDLVRKHKSGPLLWLDRKIKPPSSDWPDDASCARLAALERPDEFAAIRRKGLAKADRIVEKIFKKTETIKDVVYIIYSNHGEVFDHFRYLLPYRTAEINGRKMIEGTSHGNFPYEILYANMQMWMIPGQKPRVMKGIGRLIDFAPTVLALAGLRQEFMDGESMLPYFSRGEFPDRPRFAESPLGGGCLSMVREDGYKFIATGKLKENQKDIFALKGFPQHQLAVFDLKSDPYEYSNLIDHAEGRNVLHWAIKKHRELKSHSKNPSN
jgi:hypothetical protein